METRRTLLKSMAAAAAMGTLSPWMTYGDQPRERIPVRVGGRRVKVVDVHAHCSLDGTDALLRGTPLAGRGLPDGQLRNGLDAQRIADMDRMSVDVQVVSVNPFWYDADPNTAAQLIDFQNAKLAEICLAYPGRFAAFATVALQHPDLAALQLQAAVTRYNMRGAAIGCSVEGEELSSPRFDPFWKKAQELEALIFIHPQQSATATGIAKRVQGNGVLGNVIGNPLETTIALSHMIFEGTLDRFPELRICAAHGGGFLPSYAHRMDHGCLVFPAQCNKQGPGPKKQPSEYLRQIYFDSLVFTPEALRHLVAEWGPERFMLGTDYPYPWVTAPVDHVLQTPQLKNTDRAAILGDTACKLLGIV